MPIYELTDGRHGRFLYNTNDEFIGKSLALYGEWSEIEVSLFRQVVRPGDTVLEAGANIGTHTVFLSRQSGDAGRVLAFEPARLTFQLLCANLALNECFNVTAYQAAISDASGVAPFPRLDPRSSRNFGDVSLQAGTPGGDTEPVDVCSIDALGLSRLDFLKADIEGFEPRLLRGATETLRNLQPVLYVEIDATAGPTGNRDELVGLLEPLGYHCYYYMAPMFNPANHKQAARDEMGASSLSLLCAPAGRAEVQRLTRARVGDEAIHVEPDLLRSAVLPWTGAQFTYS